MVAGAFLKCQRRTGGVAWFQRQQIIAIAGTPTRFVRSSDRAIPWLSGSAVFAVRRFTGRQNDLPTGSRSRWAPSPTRHFLRRPIRSSRDGAIVGSRRPLMSPSSMQTEQQHPFPEIPSLSSSDRVALGRRSASRFAPRTGKRRVGYDGRWVKRRRRNGKRNGRADRGGGDSRSGAKSAI